MEILRPCSIPTNISENTHFQTTKWTNEENKTFEDLLAIYDEKTPDRWQRLASLIPNKTVADVIKHYNELVADVSSIEAGLFPIPGYNTCNNSIIISNGNNYNGFETGFKVFNDGFGNNKRPRPLDHERKKGVPWTEKEHKSEFKVDGVIKQYKELVDDVSSIEGGLFPIPGYKSCNNSMNGNNGYGDNYRGGDVFLGGFETGFKISNDGFGSNKRPRQLDHERKKGVPWTEKEHKLFLLGLRKYGKGDWRNISRNYVVTRTSTQVASHAQKYFHRQLMGGKDKRRASIHDITTVNLDESQPHAFTEKQNPPSVLSPHSKTIPGPRYQWSDRSSNGMELGSLPTNQNLFMSTYNAMNPNGSFDYVAAKNMGFQMNAAHLYPHG